MNLCRCGCGREVTKERNKYINGHTWVNRKRGPMSEERKRKQSELLIGKNKGKKKPPRSLEHRRKQSEAMKGDKNPSKRKEVRKKNSNSHIGIKKSPHREETKRRMSKIRKGKTWEQLLGGEEKAERAKRKLGKAVKENWKDPEFQRKQQEAAHTFPNKPETLILSILNELYPSEWRYTGDYSFWINGKNPDFTCINGKKLLIEHFGTYWHEEEDPKERKKIFAEFGYKTLVIWEPELKDMKKVESKIKDFIENS